MKLSVFIALGLVSFSLGCQGWLQKEKTTTERFHEFVDQKFDEAVLRHPEAQTYYGIKQDYDKLNDYSESHRLSELRIVQAMLNETEEKFQLADFDSAQGRLSYQLWIEQLNEQIDDFQWRHHRYIINQMFGVHSGLPAFMINMHSIANEKEALAYIARLREIQRVMSEVIQGLEAQQRRKILLPKFLYASIYSDFENLLKGFPLDESQSEHSLYSDFKTKVSKLKLSEEKKSSLEQQCAEALKTAFAPAYQETLTYLKKQERLADNRAGAWKLPKGEEYYRRNLRHNTTTELTAAEIHQIGLNEVKRLHGEMSALQKKLNSKRSLSQFFRSVQNNDELFYPDTTEGRAAYLRDTQTLIDSVKARLPELFGIFPKAGLIVKPVEAFREKTAGLAFYQTPAPDGSRDGIYYVNLYDLKGAPKYEMEALAYHEAIPGHHMQLAIAQELENLPKFRARGHYTAYTEGWALYGELIPKQLGFYQDPYSEFGRLSMELWRAARLVVDTGLHAKKWTRDRAINYLNANTPNAKSENIKAIDRYIVMPGQATAYKIGQLKILELREKAEKALGERFEIRSFHDELLRYGALPLMQLEEVINQWINKQVELIKITAKVQSSSCGSSEIYASVITNP